MNDIVDLGSDLDLCAKFHMIFASDDKERDSIVRISVVNVFDKL